MVAEKKLAKKISFIARFRLWASLVKSDLFVLFNAFKHPLTPWYAKAVAIFVVGYALSPIDLIPDFIPILGYVDDMLLLPLFITLAIRLIPADVMAECRLEARTTKAKVKRILWISAGCVIVIWLFIIYGVWYCFFR